MNKKHELGEHRTKNKLYTKTALDKEEAAITFEREKRKEKTSKRKEKTANKILKNPQNPAFFHL